VDFFSTRSTHNNGLQGNSLDKVFLLYFVFTKSTVKRQLYNLDFYYKKLNNLSLFDYNVILLYRKTFRYVRYPCVVPSLSTFFLLACIILTPQIQLAFGGSKSPYSSGYDYGCDDAKISDPSDRYINEPGKGPSNHTDEFMDGYYTGFDACSGRNYQPSPQQPQPQPYQPPLQRSLSWRQICNLLTPILVSPCYQLVNRDNTLTYEGERAVGCIRNGIILAGGAVYLLNLPLPLIIAALSMLSTPTGCGDIIDWEHIDELSNVQEIIRFLS
jgi:hypothetical protein